MNDAATERRRVVLQQASEWFVRLQDEQLCDADLESWGRWMAASSDHAEAFDSLTVLWDDAADLDSASILRARSERSQVTKSVSHTMEGRRRRRRPMLQRLAGIAAILVAALGTWLIVMPAPESARSWEVFVTQQGERRQVKLADGSKIDLDAGTEVRVNLSDARRAIELKQGRAFFSVSHAPESPFVVSAGEVEARALGTRFSVGFGASDAIRVSVLEGRVRVSAPEASGASGTWFDAGKGQRIDYVQGKGLNQPRDANPEMMATWRTGVVVYQGESLANIIVDLNRYSDVPIRLEDPAKGQLQVTGRWELERTERWVEGLAEAVGMTVVRGSGVIVLSSRKDLPAVDRPIQDPSTGAD